MSSDSLEKAFLYYISCKAAAYRGNPVQKPTIDKVAPWAITIAEKINEHMLLTTPHYFEVLCNSGFINPKKFYEACLRFGNDEQKSDVFRFDIAGHRKRAFM